MAQSKMKKVEVKNEVPKMKEAFKGYKGPSVTETTRMSFDKQWLMTITKIVSFKHVNYLKKVVAE